MKLSVPVVSALVLALFGGGCGSPHFSSRPGAPPSPRSGPRAVGLVRVQAPWYATRSAIAGRFRDAVPEYEAVPHLESKYFTVVADGRFGGIYLWESRADAHAYHSEDWRVGIRRRRGVDPELVVLDAPFLVEGTTVLEGEPIGQRALRYPATATLALWPAAPRVEGGTTGPAEVARRLAAPGAERPGLVRALVVMAGPEQLGFVGLWATRELAQRALRAESLATLGGAGAEVTYFEAPVLIEAGLRTP
jgi:hypothetical protein